MASPITQNLTPPASNSGTTCRRVQMSKWRQKGFVQDSDEEEDESQLESQGYRQDVGLSGRVERVERTEPIRQHEEATAEAQELEKEDREESHAVHDIQEVEKQEEVITTPTKGSSPRRPTPSPFTPKSAQSTQRELTESPDPLQASSTPKTRRNVSPPLSSQHLASPVFQPSSAVSVPQLNNNYSVAITGESALPVRSNTARGAENSKPTSGLLQKFGIVPLSDDSDDDTSDLSDPPTDMESPPVTFAEPHRRTAVQVVIPASTALQRQIADDRARREFRQRKPIQMHPYALEGEIYRREVQSRGLKPVRRERSRSPQGHRRQQNDETQEQEFNPDESPTSSPLDVEIPVSTPVVSRPKKDHTHRHNPGSIRRVSSTQLRCPHAAKRRKLNISSTQAAAAPTSIFEDRDMRRDIWSIPPNSPPYSSSPPLKGSMSARHPDMLRSTTPAPNLPTPSTSSVIQDDPQILLESDSEQAPRSIQRSGGQFRRPTRVVITDSSSSASEAEKSENEIRYVGRKIKGVLPASWLRQDRQAQERRQAEQRERDRVRMNAAVSPEPTAPVRGVAQRIMRPSGRPLQSSASNTPSTATVVISDESDDEPGPPVTHRLQRVHDSMADASALAAMFEDRYADDNLSDMEHDRLPLPTLGGTGSKRKRQTKLTDAFGKSKKVRSSLDSMGKSVANGKRLSGTTSGKRKHGNSRKPRKTPLPAMSVIDVDISTSQRGDKIPQFLRIARRQALQRPDLARQSPRNKQIRLHNVEDTEEANTTLGQWRRGTLKPKSNIAPHQRKPRHPLTNRIDNQQHTEQRSLTGGGSLKELDMRSEVATDASRSHSRKSISTSLRIFQRSTSQKKTKKPTQGGKKHAQPNKDPEQTVRRMPLPFRAAQLEGDEDDFGRGHRKIAFEKGLLRVDQQFGLQLPSEPPFVNPQLARYLADDNTELPPLPSADDVGDGQTEVLQRQQPPHKRRLKRKVQAQRIDIDAREYRQPSEPAVQEILATTDVVQVQAVETEEGLPILNGLAPYGTRYPITFDVYSLAADTYFHSSTFIGSDEFRRALLTGNSNGRNLDNMAGYYTITYGTLSVRCGPWNDETFSRLQDVAKTVSEPLGNHDSESEKPPPAHESLTHLTRLVRSLIGYVTNHLSFLDPIDRNDCVSKLGRLCQSLFDSLLVAQSRTNGHDPGYIHGVIRAMTYLLVVSFQLHCIAQHPTVDQGNQVEVVSFVKSLAKTVITHLVRHGVPSLSRFLEQNKRHAVREKGIQETEAAVESVVICMHVLDEMDMSSWSFWDLISQDLGSKLPNSTSLHTFETTWASLFTLLPYNEIDASGIPLRSRRETFQRDNWTCIRDLLRRLFELYPSTYKKYSASVNDYMRANLARCHRLITHWHWSRPKLMLNVVFDFFGKIGLKSLRRESGVGSVPFLNNLATSPSFSVEQNENSFHIALKCLALGLQGMKNAYSEKEIRSFVFRSLPNHGRAYPKDQPLDEENLAALRNHHDLLSTLYWAAPPTCRPKLDHMRDLVNHESSHREACRVSVRAWANLTTFQLSTEEAYASAQPFALWHKDIMHQTLRQYKLAKTEADDYLKSGVLDGTTDVSVVMVCRTMERNQEQVIATLRDCIAGMKRAIHHAREQSSVRAFLVDSELMCLLELPHLEDRRLVDVIRDTMKVLQDYARAPKAQSKDTSQQTSEESQDYGDFPDMDDLEDIDFDVSAKLVQQSGLDYIQTPLWHLLSNAFGAETSPDDNLLMDCIDTWVRVAQGQVASGERSWSYYLDSFSQVSWKQLRHTEQTRKFGPYFMAAILDCDSTAYEEHRHDFIQALMVCLVERESMLRFQHRLLYAIARTDGHHPLMQNLPFFRNLETNEWDITAETLRTRRLALISSILSNMRDDVRAITQAEPARLGDMKRLYASMLKDFMTTMKYNYEQLRQGTTVTGAYVEFVQKVVQFLKQYTNDICPVLPFFTDSVAFPLPAGDPSYVVARLCGYAPKLSDTGTGKELSHFIETVLQQAAADNQQMYLVNQLTTALCTEEAPTADRVALRSVLLQGVIPIYLEEALSSSTVFAITRPILQVLPSILDTMIYDLRITQPNSLASTVGCIVSVAHAFIRGTEPLKDNQHWLEQSHVIAALTHMLEAVMSILSPLEYICSRTMSSAHLIQPPLVTYIDQLSIFIAQLLEGATPETVPSYDGDAHAPPQEKQHAEVLSFCRSGLKDGLKKNWSESNGCIWFGQGHARREVLFDIGSVEEERERLAGGIQRFQSALRDTYGDEEQPYDDDEEDANSVYNFVV